jgi:hypothetical protein
MNERKAGAVERQRVAGAHEMVLAVAVLCDPQRAFQTLHTRARAVAKAQDLTGFEAQFGAIELEVHGDSFHNAASAYQPGSGTGPESLSAQRELFGIRGAVSNDLLTWFA